MEVRLYHDKIALLKCRIYVSAVTVTAKKRVVTVKGPRGTLSKSFRHIQCELTMLSKKKIRVDLWFANRKRLACLRTVCSHIENLMKGVTYVSPTFLQLHAGYSLLFIQGYLYKMRAVYAHFPINITMSDDHTIVDIRNFLGEKYTRTVRMHEGVTCKPTGTKDEIKIEGNDLEKVSLSG